MPAAKLIEGLRPQYRHHMAGQGSALLTGAQTRRQLGLGAEGLGAKLIAPFNASLVNGFPTVGTSLDLDFLNQVAYVRGMGVVPLSTILTLSGGAGGTRVNIGGQIESASCPRFDYDPLSLAPRGLLIEAQRTNSRFPYNDINAWPTRTNSTVASTSNAAIAPDGTMTASKLVSDSGAIGFFTKGVDHTAGTTYTVVAFFAPAGRTSRLLLAPGGLFTDAQNRLGTFTLTGDGSVVTSGSGCTATIRLVGFGYYLCTLTFTPEITLNAGIQLRDYAAGDGVNGVYAWGAMHLDATAATSLIPATGAAVTRTADQVSMTGSNFSNWFNPVEGTVMFRGVVLSETTTDTTARVIGGVSTASINESMYITRTSNSGAVYLNIVDGGVGQVSNMTPGAVTANTAFNIGFRYRENNIGICLNGGAVLQDTVATLPTVDRAGIGCAPWSPPNNSINGVIGRFKYCPRWLPDELFRAHLQ